MPLDVTVGWFKNMTLRQKYSYGELIKINNNNNSAMIISDNNNDKHDKHDKIDTDDWRNYDENADA